MSEKDRERESGSDRNNINNTNNSNNNNNNVQRISRSWIHLYIYILPYNNNMEIDIMAPCDTEALHSTQKLHVIIAM